jgi:hypothetical protein
MGNDLRKMWQTGNAKKIAATNKNANKKIK